MNHLRLSRTSSSRRVLGLEFIRRYFREHGSSPSHGEIAAGLGMAKRRVGPMIEEWAQAAVLTFTPKRGRSIVLVDRAANLSDSELELACRARGWTIRKSPLPMLTDAIPAVPIGEGVRNTDCNC